MTRGSEQAEHSFTCAILDRFFLYLPLLFAEEKNFFRLLPEGYSFKTQVMQGANDAEILAKVLDTSDESSAHISFGVCDPMAVFEVADRHTEAAQLCALVANTTFWAVDRRADQIRSYEEIGRHYSKIISYAEGSTSHAIARRVQASCATAVEILPVRPPTEWAVLNDNQDAIALTPDVLRMVRHRERRGYTINYNFTECPDYSNVVLSVLVTRRDVVEQHKDFIAALTRAIQLAVSSIHGRRPEIHEYASSAWPPPDGKYAATALELALKDKSFPESIKISPAPWLKAAKLWCLSRGKEFDENVAHLMYRNTVSSYNRFAEDAFEAVQKAGAEAMLTAGLGSRMKQWALWWASNRVGLVSNLLASLALAVPTLRDHMIAAAAAIFTPDGLLAVRQYSQPLDLAPAAAFAVAVIVSVRRDQFMWVWAGTCFTVAWLVNTLILPFDDPSKLRSIGVFIGLFVSFVSSFYSTYRANKRDKKK